MMKKYPLLIILIVSTIILTIPGVLLNLKVIKTSESENYGLKNTGVSSAVHEIKQITGRLYAYLTRNENTALVEGALNGEASDPDGSDTGKKVAELIKKAEAERKAGGSSGNEAAESGAEGEQSGEGQAEQGPVDYGDTESPRWQTVGDDYFLDACFIGDSRMKGFGMYSGLTTTTYAKVGLQLYKIFDDRIVDTVYGKLTVPEALASNIKFNKIYLMFGLNEMGSGNNEQFAQNYYQLIDAIKALQPQAIIYIQQIIHVSAGKQESQPVFANSAIDERNEVLRRVASDEHVYYLELNEVFTDEYGNLPEGYSFDGVHIAASSMQIWKDYLKTHAIIREISETEGPAPVSENAGFRGAVSQNEAAISQNEASVSDNAIGLLMGMKDVSPAGATLVYSQHGGTVSGSLITGQLYEIQAKGADGEWISPIPVAGDEAWTDTGLSISNDGDTEQTVNWQGVYGFLSPGHYRLKKRVIDLREPGDYDTYDVVCEFDI